MDLKLQMDDSDKECEEDTEIMENDAMDSEPVSEGMPKLYSVQQINNFLDVTKGLRKPKIESHFPDLKMFLLSGTMPMRKASFDELDKPKRYRLKKLLSNVKSALNVQGKNEYGLVTCKILLQIGVIECLFLYLFTWHL